MAGVEKEHGSERAEEDGVTMRGEQWLVIVTCRDEAHQVEVLKRFQGEGLPCRALVG